VRRNWSETELVRSFGGQLFPGTPDGMFESWDGVLTCVQVVRVPLVPDMSLDCMQDTLAQTVLCKVVKSQQWLRAVHVVPQDFVIFCWLPFTVDELVTDHAQLLMERVRQLDPRFSLRLRVPALPGALFPARFASTSRSEARSRSVSESDVSPYIGDEESDDEEARDWDITWDWEADWTAAEGEQERCGEDVKSEGGDTERVALPEGHVEVGVVAAWEMECDITWGWDLDWTVSSVQRQGACVQCQQNKSLASPGGSDGTGKIQHGVGESVCGCAGFDDGG